MTNFPIPSDVKVIVLTLRQSTDRQMRIKSLLDEAKIPFEFFWGVDGRKDADPLFSLYDETIRLRTKGQPMSPGQLGCFASHYKLWANCVAENKKYIVLEDDALFEKEKFLTFIKNLPLLPSHFECLRLFENKTRNHREYVIAKVGAFEVIRYTKGPMSTMGYYLTPGAAKKFLMSTDPIFLPVDIFMDRYWVNDVVCLGINPAFVFIDSEFESTIGYGKKSGRRPLFVRFNRELFTLTERVRRYFYNLLLRRKYKTEGFSDDG